MYAIDLMLMTLCVCVCVCVCVCACAHDKMVSRSVWIQKSNTQVIS